jgi:hypothetical protein
VDSVENQNLQGAVAVSPNDAVHNTSKATASGQSTRWWLYTHRFDVTKSLLARIAHLPVKEQERYCYIQNKVILLAREMRSPQMYVNVGARYFQGKCQNNYLKDLKQLEQWGELKRNDKYCSDASKSPTGKTFTMSYCVPAAAWNSGIITKDYRCKKQRAPVDKSTVTDDHLMSFYKEIYVKPNAVIPDTLDFEYAVEMLAKIEAGVANIKVGKNGGRWFHTTIEMPRELRENLAHRSGRRLGEGDIKCCHPFFLVKYCGPEERERYIKFVEEPYNKLIKDLGISYTPAQLARYKKGKPKTTRDAVKIDFLKFLNGCVKNYVYHHYAAHFPILTAWIMKQGRKGMAKTLQGMESEIMIGKVRPECNRRGLATGPHHDGWMGFEDEAAEVAQIVIKEVKEAVGYAPKVKFTVFETGAETEIDEISKDLEGFKGIGRDREGLVYVTCNGDTGKIDKELVSLIQPPPTFIKNSLLPFARYKALEARAPARFSTEPTQHSVLGSGLPVAAILTPVGNHPDAQN